MNPYACSCGLVVYGRLPNVIDGKVHRSGKKCGSPATQQEVLDLYVMRRNPFYIPTP